jgi:hypothetical protein
MENTLNGEKIIKIEAISVKNRSKLKIVDPFFLS